MSRRSELAVAAQRVVSSVKGASTTLHSQETGNGASSLAAAATGRFDAAVDDCLAAIIDLAAEKQHGKEPLEHALSLQEQGSLRTAFELIIVWGLMPLLLPRVGVPLSKRSKSASSFLLPPSRPLSLLTLNRLQFLVTSLISIFVDADLYLFFAAHYMVDLVASLMQLAFLPATEPLLSGEPQVAISVVVQAKFANELMHVLESAPAPLSIESLLLLSGRSAAQAPVWLRQRCFGLLSSILLRPGAVPAFIAQLFDGLDPTQINEAGHAAARLLLTAPAKIPKDTYYAAIAPQLFHILRVAESRLGDKTAEYSVQTVSLCLCLASPAARSVLYRSVTEHLLRLQRALTIEFSEQIPDASIGAMSEKEVTDCISALISLHRTATAPTIAALQELLEPLFLLYSFALASRSSTRATVEVLLVSVMKEGQRSGGVLLSALLPPTTRPLLPLLVFGPGGSGGVELRKNTDKHERNAEVEAAALVQLLKVVDQEQLSGDIFVSLLERLTDGNDLALATGTAKLGEEDHERSFLSQRIRLLTLLAHITEATGPGVLNHSGQILSLLRILLGSQEEEISGLSLAILAALLEGPLRLTKAEEVLLFDLVSPLSALCLSPNTAHAETAARLRATISTRDQKWADEEQKEDKKSPDDEGARLTEALRECNDGLLPVRAKGLVTLRRMLLSRSPVALRNTDRIAALLLARLHDEDSYVYLSAVSALAALGDCAPKTFIPTITKQMEERTNPLSVRMRLAEAITQVSYRLGDALAQHSDLLFPPLLRLLFSREVEVRASSLSVLSTVCQVTRHGMQPYLGILVDSLTSAISIDTSVEVRRGAVLLLGNILWSLGVDAPTVLAKALGSLLELLARLAETDIDPVVRVHASEALAALQECMEKKLTPQTRIKTLD